MNRILSRALAATLLLPSLGLAQQVPTYPEGVPVPRSLTPVEARWLEEHPLRSNLAAVTPPPPGPIHCVAEYEPMGGILIAWEGGSDWKSVLATLATQFTTTGDADVHVACDSSSEASSALSQISSYGADMSRVETMVVTTDTIWIRDYGPRYIYQGDVRSIIDHTYNRPRPNDNQLPGFFAGHMGHAIYELALVHGGGNFHLDANDHGFATRLIKNENPGLSEQQIFDIWWDYQHLATNIMTPLPSYIDSTQHIDMWLQVISDDAVVISDWPWQSGTTQDNVCDAAAAEFATLGYTVHRTPAHSTGGTHYTYTNVVMCNDLVVIPSYTNGTVQSLNSQALATWQAACPTKTIYQLNGQSLVTSAGVFHCIVMHMPAHLGGVNPTAHVVYPQGGEALVPGTTATIEWLSDDDEGVSSTDLLLSTDGGATYPTTIATGLAPMGSFDWTVPSLDTTQARIRAFVRDGVGNTGHDDSDQDFTISTTSYATVTPYGSGKAGTLGVPLLDSQTPPVLGTSGTIDLSQGLPGGDAYFIVGVYPAADYYDETTVLVDYFTFFVLPIDGAGDVSLPFSIPPGPGLAGLSIYWQVWIPNDPMAAGQGWATSNGLQTRMGY